MTGADIIGGIIGGALGILVVVAIAAVAAWRREEVGRREGQKAYRAWAEKSLTEASRDP